MPSRKPAPRPRFGEVAVARGYCTARDVTRALKIQADQDRLGGKHPPAGIIMISEGILSTTQLIEILKQYDAKA